MYRWWRIPSMRGGSSYDAFRFPEFVAAATCYRRSFGAAITLAVMGYHFQVMTRRLSKFEMPALPAEAGEQT